MAAPPRPLAPGPDDVTDLPLPARLGRAAQRGWASTRGWAAMLWKAMGEDDVFFLASAIAFNLMLAVAPFLLLLISLSVTALGNTPDAAADHAMVFLDRFLPEGSWEQGEWIRTTLRDVARAGTSVSVWSALVFAWFSTRVFGALRAVMVKTFDVEKDRGIVSGKLFDIGVAFALALGVLLYGVLSAYLVAGTAAGGALLRNLGLHEAVLGRVDYAIGRGVAFALVVMIVFGLFRWLPNRPIPNRTALVGAVTTTLLFEAMRWAFTAFAGWFRPSSYYTGALAAVVAATLWVYYSAVIFVVGAEVAQVYELRRDGPAAPRIRRKRRWRGRNRPTTE